ncbi:MAG TPA: COX15/CtaA family protein [Caldimonas sp.]|jgi:cytochrome c oxidase assembly protein subunit 15|nr:COX15/CtaA family protein [Caldimonas sp.]
MSAAAATVDLAPLLGVLGAGTALALVPLAWFWRRSRGDAPALRLQAFAWFVLFLSFDLVLLGAFTRLSDSGLGCPDWPGCYGHASPVGASVPIAAAQADVPTGAVTATKAWIEMLHRYAATAIGVLVVVLAALAIGAARRSAGRIGFGWALWTLLWICVQGAFGALTVAWRLYPAIVTLHLIGGVGLLALLAIQAERYAPRRLELAPGLRAGLVAVAVLTLVQIALGAWVSSNYAVLACSDFPTCQGAWWPDMDVAQGFVVRRPLGGGDAGYLPFAALTAIHMAHRLGALVLLPAIAAFAWRLHVAGAATRPWALALLGLIVWQAASGLGNVLLGWPLAAAVAHTAGAAALVVVLTVLLVRSAPPRAAHTPVDAGGSPALAS